MSSIKSSIEANIRVLVLEMISLAIVRPEPAEANRAQVLDAVAKDVFGNIAFYQASEATTFPDVERRVPTITVGTPAVDHNFAYNIRSIVENLKVLIQTSGNEAMRGATFRQVCAPFAEGAKAFLRECYLRNGKVSALAETVPALCERAPWVAFDFNRGLNFRTLTADERRVIQNLNRRLINTQMKLAVTGAAVDGQTGDLVA